jgi:hypothetical protein
MQVSAEPDVTVLMAVRNGARHLAAAVESILAQTHANLEFVVCDDGSTDDTPHLLARYAAEDARIKPITLPAGGLVAALNHGLAAARAEWVARMDADDIAWPERLRVQLAAAAARPDAAAIGSAWRIIDPSGRPLGVVRPPTEPDAIAAALLERNCLAHPTMLLRRAAVMALGGYRAAFRYAEDYDLWLRLSEHHALYAIDEPLLDYREHPGQVSRTALEQRVFAEFGAQLAARARRTGGTDPGTGTGQVSHAWLMAAGAGEAEIRARLIGGALGAAKHALRAKDPAAAREAIRLLWSQKRLHPRTRLHGLLLQAAAGLMRAQPPPP